MNVPIHAEIVATRHSGQTPRRASGLEIIRMARGHATWAIEGESFPVKEDDIIIVFPGQLFSGVESSESVPIRAECLELNFPKFSKLSPAQNLAKILGIQNPPATLLLETLRKLQPPLAHAGQDGARLCQEIIRHVEAKSPIEQAYLQACIVKLLTHLCLLTEGHPAKTTLDTAQSEARVALFLQELETRCAEPWTLETMADETRLKRSRFGTICRQLTGENPITFLSRLRVRASRKLLRETNRSITDIALECGFGSSQYFAKIFRRYQGHEPTHFRQLSVETRQGRGIHYIKGDTARTVAHLEHEVCTGNFTIECRLTLDRLGGTAASFELGPDRFGFDGRMGALFLEGETFGAARFFAPSRNHIREGSPFDFQVQRIGSKLNFAINRQVITTVTDSSQRKIGLVGLRPLRNGIHIHSFRLDGKEMVLKDVDLT
jgi:AraC-like DNA-binding protein